MSGIKVKDAEIFTRFLITLGAVFAVDQEGYIVRRFEEDEPAYLKVGNKLRRLMVIKELITDNDALVINPLNENISESPDSKWLYQMMNIGLSRRIIEMVKFVHMTIESSKADAEAEMEMSIDAIELASRHKDFDAKAFKAFELMTKEKLSFVTVWYNRKQKESHFRCSLFDSETVNEYPQVTKKSMKAIVKLLAELFNVSNDPELAFEQLRSEYTIGSELISVPKLESILKVYAKIYRHMNKYLAICEMDDDDFVVDMTSLDQHIENIPEYYKAAKWLNTSSVCETETKPACPVGAIPVVTSAIPSNPMIQTGQQMVGYTEQPSSIPSNPMRRMNEYAPQVPQQQFHQQFQPQFQQPNYYCPSPNQFAPNQFMQNQQIPIVNPGFGGGFIPIR